MTGLWSFISGSLYTSADFYYREENLSVFNMKRIISLFPSEIQILVVWLIAMIAIFSYLRFFILKKPCFLIEIVQNIGLPYALYCGVSLLHNIQKHDFQIMETNFTDQICIIIPLIIILALIIGKLKNMHLIYDNSAKNSILRIQIITRILEITKIIFCSVIHLYINNKSLVFLLCSTALIITAYKIIYMTYYDPHHQLCLLLSDLWGWISLIIFTLKVYELPSQSLYALLPILGYIAFNPPSLVIKILEEKIIWNIKNEKANYQSSNSEAIVIYYACKIFRNQRNHIIFKKFSRRFILYIEQEIRKCEKRPYDTFTVATEYSQSQNRNITPLNTLDEHQKIILIYSYIETKNIIKKHYKNNFNKSIFLFWLFSQFASIRFEEVCQYYYLYFYENQKSLNTWDRITLQSSYENFKKAKLKTQNKNSIILQISQNDHIYKLLKQYKQNQQLYISIMLKTKTKMNQFKEFLQLRSKLKKYIQKQLSLLSTVGQKNIHFILVQFIINKFVHNNPILAQKYFIKQIQQLRQSQKTVLAYSTQNNQIFATSLSGKNQIKYFNNNFAKAMEIQNQQSLELSDIIPILLRKKHEEILHENFNNLCNIYSHSLNPYYFLNQKTSVILEGTMNVRLLTELETQILAIAVCNIKTGETINLEEFSMNVPVITSRRNCQYNHQIRVIMNNSYQVSKISRVNNFLTQCLFNMSQNNNSCIKTQAIVQKKAEQLQKKYQILERQKYHIDPLKKTINKNKKRFFILFTLTIGIVLTITQSMRDFIKTSIEINIFQDKFYQILILTQLYTPVLLSIEKIGLKNYDKQQIQYLFTQVQQQFKSHKKILLDEISKEKVLQSTFEPFKIRNQTENVYLSDIILKLSVQFNNLQIFSHSKENQQFIEHSLDFISLIQEQYQYNLFSSIHKILFKNNQQIYKRQLLIFWLGIFVISGFILLGLFLYFKLKNSVQGIFRKIIVSDQSLQGIQKHIAILEDNIQSLKKNSLTQYSVLDKPALRQNLLEDQIKEKKQEGHIYNYKSSFIIICLLYIFLILCLNITCNPAMNYQRSKNIETFQFFKFSVSYIKPFQLLLLKFLAYDQMLEKYSQQLSRDYYLYKINQKNLHQTFSTIFESNPEIITETQGDPCQYFINCSSIVTKHIQKPVNLYVSRNIMIVVLEKIVGIFSDEIVQSQLKQNFSKGFQAIIFMNKLTNAIMNKFSFILQHYQQAKQQQIYLIQAFALLATIAIICQLFRIFYSYNNLRKQVFTIMPTNIMINDQNYTKEVNMILYSY